MRPEALESLRMDRENLLTRQFPLLEAPTEDEVRMALEGGGEVATMDADSGDESP